MTIDHHDPETARIRAIYDHGGEALTPGEGGWFLGDGRRWVAGQARGDTLEVGIGSGLTLPYYGPDVRLTGLELSPVMLAIARRRAAEIGVDVTLRLGDAMRLDVPDASVDTVVYCLVLCTVPDDRVAIMEAGRVLRQGGRLVALEHVRSPNPMIRLGERLWEPIGFRRYADHPLRDPVDHLAAAGLTIESLERRRLGILERLVARR